MRDRLKIIAVSISICTALAVAGPSVSLSAMLDSDVWSNLAGDFFTNDELDIGVTTSFSESISAHLYTTIRGGAIPARMGEPGMRWVSMVFDGVDISFTTKTGTFTVGDLVYQYGKFNYYFYKRASMITPESFTRGLSYTFSNDRLSQTILAGASDDADILFERKVISTAGDTLSIPDGVESDRNSGDLGGVSKLTFTDNANLSLFYGIRSDVKKGFNNTAMIYAGLELNTMLVEALSVKADIGLRNSVNDDIATSDIERSTVIPILLEPVFTSGKFSTALSAYYVIDTDNSGIYPGAGEQMFIYMEPGLSFNEKVAVGLPLEIHSMGKAGDIGKTGEFWTVPTAYIYPVSGIQWWIWAGGYFPLKNNDPYYGIGSEIVVKF